MGPLILSVCRLVFVASSRFFVDACRLLVGFYRIPMDFCGVIVGFYRLLWVSIGFLQASCALLRTHTPTNYYSATTLLLLVQHNRFLFLFLVLCKRHQSFRDGLIFHPTDLWTRFPGDLDEHYQNFGVSVVFSLTETPKHPEQTPFRKQTVLQQWSDRLFSVIQ